MIRKASSYLLSRLSLTIFQGYSLVSLWLLAAKYTQVTDRQQNKCRKPVEGTLMSEEAKILQSVYP